MHLSIDNLCMTYSRSRQALKGVSIELDHGMFGLLGPNGAGKTTLMKILVTLLPPTGGSVRYDGLMLGRDNGAIRRLIGYLPQSYGLYHKLTARETLDYFASLSGLAKGQQRKNIIDDLLQRVNLLDDASRQVGGFSGGMKQRLGIAQALLNDPALLIVDEPTAGLDPAERIRFRNLLQNLSGERIVILSTHIVSDISSSCDDMAVLANGQLCFRGRPDQYIRKALGKVWQTTVEPAQAAKIEAHYRVVNAVRRSEGVALRLLADQAQVSHLPQITAQDPTLEDAYLLSMGLDQTEGSA